MNNYSYNVYTSFLSSKNLLTKDTSHTFAKIYQCAQEKMGHY